MAMATSTDWRLKERIRVSGGEVAAGIFGDGPPVILVHGTPAWSFLWRDVVPELAQRHTVYALDLLGFGHSRIDPGVAPSIAQQASTLAELIEHWRLDEPCLVGHDIGGGIVLRAHLIHDVPVRCLALLDAAVLGHWKTPLTAHMQRHADAYRTMPSHVFDDVITPRLRTATHRPMSEAVARAYHAPWAGPDGQQRWIDQVVAVSFEDTRDVVAQLDRITAPTLVLWGEQDEWLVPSTGDRLASAIPGARLEMIADAGHFLPEDRPEEVADALLRFFM
jgi:pimeloyl-ACP methyl ester carboxylesterase